MPSTRCADGGINILDCWMSDPAVRSAIGKAIHKNRDRWIVQGHFGSTWQDEQYVRTRDMDQTTRAFEDLLTLLQTDHIDLGMIHFVDSLKELDEIFSGPFYGYVRTQKEKGVMGHIGLSTHNPCGTALR